MAQKVISDGQGGHKLATRKSPPRKDKVFRRLQESVSRDEWLAAFAAAPDERAQMLFERMMDPAFRTHSLPKLAKDVGLTYPQVLKLITQFRVDQGILRMSAHVPQVMEDVAVDAQSKEVTCGSCKGYKVGDIASVPVTESVYDEEKKRQVVLQKLDKEGRPMWERCLTCDGVGTLRKIGDADARKIMFETLKLTGRSAPLVVQQFNTGGASMEDAVGAAQDVLDVQPERVAVQPVIAPAAPGGGADGPR